MSMPWPFINSLPVCQLLLCSQLLLPCQITRLSTLRTSSVVQTSWQANAQVCT